MTTTRQKDLELAHLEKALKLNGVRNYSIIDKDGESPDFLINIAGEIIGIEVTSIYRDFDDGNSAKAQSDLPVITEEAVKAYNAKGGIPLVFSFSYDGKVAVSSRKSIAQELGELLYEYTKKNFSSGIDTIQQINVTQESDGSLSFVSSVFVQPTDHATAVGGITVSGFDTVPLVDSMIEEAVRKKEKLLPKYLQRCEKAWLLIVLPTMNLAGDLSMQENKNITLNHSFDAVFVLDDYRSQLQRINSPVVL